MELGCGGSIHLGPFEQVVRIHVRLDINLLPRKASRCWATGALDAIQVRGVRAALSILRTNHRTLDVTEGLDGRA